MKTQIKILTALLLAAALYSCQKTGVKLTPLTSLNLTNAIIGDSTVMLNTNTNFVTNNSFGQFGLMAGQTQIKVASPGTPNTPYYNQTTTTVNGSYYSLFLTGASTASVDAILIKETYQNYTDSLCGVRFINLSPDSQPINVDIAGNANGSEVTSLAYKAYTGFKQYPAKTSTPTYTFEVRDVVTGNLIATYTLNTPYYHNVTLALTGSEIASTANILQVNEY